MTYKSPEKCVKILLAFIYQIDPRRRKTLIALIGQIDPLLFHLLVSMIPYSVCASLTRQMSPALTLPLVGS